GQELTGRRNGIRRLRRYKRRCAAAHGLLNGERKSFPATRQDHQVRSAVKLPQDASGAVLEDGSVCESPPGRIVFGSRRPPSENPPLDIRKLGDQPSQQAKALLFDESSDKQQDLSIRSTRQTASYFAARFLGCGRIYARVDAVRPEFRRRLEPRPP